MNVARSIVVELISLMASIGFLLLVVVIFAPIDHDAGPGFVLGHP